MIIQQSILHPYTTQFVRALKEAGSHDLFPYEIRAIDALVRDLLFTGLWSKMITFYPFVGRAPVPHSFNLIDPYKYRITWSGTLIHNDEGVKGDGSSGYGNTNFNPNGVIVGNTSGHLCLYSRIATVKGSNIIDIGVDAGGSQSFLMAISWSGGNGFDSFNNSSAHIGTSVASDIGFFLGNRNSAGAAIYRNKTNLVSTTNTGGSAPNRSIFVFAYNDGSPQTLSDRQFASGSIGFGFQEHETVIYYDIIQKYQTLLNRQV